MCRTVIRVFESIVTVRVCEPRPPAVARTRVVSESRIDVENVPSARVVRRRTTLLRPLTDSSTGTPPRAGAMLPRTRTGPAPTRLAGARSWTDETPPGPPPPAAATRPPPVPPHDPTT